MPSFDEKSLVEDYFVEQLQRKGWRFISADDLERESLEEPLLTPVLFRQLKHKIGDEEIKQALNELKLKGRGIEHAKQVLNYFKQGIPVKFEKERVVKYVKLFDYDNLESNEYAISRQVIHQAADKKIRNDIILYINGIPLINIECKNPSSLTETWYNAYTQIKEYEQAVPELYKYTQIGVAAQQTAKYFPIVPWQPDPHIHQWREPNRDSIDSTITMLTSAILLNIIRNYVFFRIEHGNATKVVARYMQYRASEQIANRVINYLRGKEDKNKGLIWHWQGSGKTLTMIFAANKLYQHPTLENPTIFFIVDRQELQEQLYQEFTALDISKPEIITSINDLTRTLKHDQGKGKRGLHITLIHKFRPEEFEGPQKALTELSKSRDTILTRRNVVAFVDEGHRTQYGTLAGQIRSILKNAAFFAFTGTPISKRHRNTYDQFSNLPEERYLDKYFITDSIRDGFTVKIAYQPRLEKDVHLNKEMLEAFLEVELEEIPEEYHEKVQAKVKKRLNKIRVILENEKRIKKVAEDVAEHFKENVDGKFKAIVVAVSRKACVRYKRALDQFLPKEYSEVVMTFTRDDPSEIQEYLKELTALHKGKEVEDIRKEVVDRFKEEELPKILIVTDMLLTGFDAPVLQTMYLDKPLKEHRLLQAIARTNRPYKDTKEAGMILDYVGILKNFVKAFENYTREDTKDVLYTTEDLERDFVKTLAQTLEIFQDIPKDQYDRPTMLKAIEAVTVNEKSTRKFMENYKHLRKMFELLGPHEVKIQKFREYTWLTQVYIFYIGLTRQRPPEERYVPTYFRKTLKYVYKTTQIENFQKDLPTIQFDENYLKNLQEKVKTKEGKAANIVFTLNRFILVEKTHTPVYETLAQKVERILKHWKQRTKDYEQIYKEGQQIIEELSKLQDRQKQLGYTNLQYAILLTLEDKLGPEKTLTQDTQELTAKIEPLMFKGWTTQPTARKNIERETRKFLRKYIKQHGLSLNELENLYQKTIENVKTYGKAS
jgi:type I restriction enzyme R subunit